MKRHVKKRNSLSLNNLTFKAQRNNQYNKQSPFNKFTNLQSKKKVTREPRPSLKSVQSQKNMTPQNLRAETTWQYYTERKHFQTQDEEVLPRELPHPNYFPFRTTTRLKINDLMSKNRRYNHPYQQIEDLIYNQLPDVLSPSTQPARTFEFVRNSPLKSKAIHLSPKAAIHKPEPDRIGTAVQLSPKVIHRRELSRNEMQTDRIVTAIQLSPKVIYQRKRSQNEMVYSVFKSTRKKIVKEKKRRNSLLTPW